MKTHGHNYKNRFLKNAIKFKGLWFHIIGLAAIVWFVIRVVPAPHRFRYPCQQMSVTVALTYIAFWIALFAGLKIWLRHARFNTSKMIPSIAAIFVILLMISGAAFAVNYYNQEDPVTAWDPVPKEPIGDPKGVNPGRVAWIWNPDSTEHVLDGYWWESQNNNQEVIDQMYSSGLQELTGEEDDNSAWDSLFRYFNIAHENGDVGYQPGEKIAIKINMNNGFYENYDWESDDIDASPYVVKGLLRQLINVGVAQEDITVYDASRKLFDWFYNRVYYEEFPADPLVPEFADVHFVDLNGAPGREQIVSSGERVYFAAGTCQYRTLPTVVVDATYMINMPIAKRHMGDRVTLSGKNWFGTWMEDVASIHNYHTIGYSAMGNPAPQTDLFASGHLGQKCVLHIGDGTYGSRYGLADCTYFEMYPFNGDWMSSLFFSQDMVAIDSVMYDFFYVEGTSGGPSEGAQNYLHQAADPPEDVYDPENDGVYLSDSLGVHEHWDPSIDIFSSERYSGPANNGIDFIPIGEEHAGPGIIITKPKEKHLYIAGNEIRYLTLLQKTIILGKIDVETEINGVSGDIEKVEFYIDGQLENTDYEEPYEWTWDRRSFFRHDIETKVFFDDKSTASDSVFVWKFF